MRGIQHIFGVSRNTLAVWLQKRPDQPNHKRDIVACGT
jgi:hypothetical protein